MNNLEPKLYGMIKCAELLRTKRFLILLMGENNKFVEETGGNKRRQENKENKGKLIIHYGKKSS
jgi:hypothetical protein